MVLVSVYVHALTIYDNLCVENTKWVRLMAHKFIHGLQQFGNYQGESIN